MTAKSKVQSIEPNIADMANSWLKSYELDYKLEQESLNTEIDQALNNYSSKNGGKGGNRPDAKLLLRADDGKYYPILIEYKGYEDKLVKTTLLPNQYLFMVMCINKVTDLPIYSYKNKLGGWNVVKEKHIRLPQKNDKIDLGLMDSFISAMKKLTIKDVALYADRKIEATKTIVSSKSVE